MESNLAKQLEAERIAAERQRSPEERLRAFLAHNRLVSRLHEAARRELARGPQRKP
jgi:hypothetical protein